jgi:hypothetical protein
MGPLAGMMDARSSPRITAGPPALSSIPARKSNYFAMQQIFSCAY